MFTNALKQDIATQQVISSNHVEMSNVRTKSWIRYIHSFSFLWQLTNLSWFLRKINAISGVEAKFNEICPKMFKRSKTGVWIWSVGHDQVLMNFHPQEYASASSLDFNPTFLRSNVENKWTSLVPFINQKLWCLDLIWASNFLIVLWPSFIKFSQPSV